MRTVFCLLLLAAGLAAEDLPITGLAHVGFLVSGMEKARQFYSGMLGYEEAFHLNDDAGKLSLAYFKVNDDQYIEVFPGLAPDQNVRMTHIALLTPDIERLRRMLGERGLSPGQIARGRDGNLNCSLKDPDGTRLEFVQYLPGSLHSKARGKFLGRRRLSDHLWHAGVLVANLDPALAFYRDKLGFRETWRWGPSQDTLSYVTLRMPGPGGDYVEFILRSGPATRAALGSIQHICLEAPDVHAAYRQALERGAPSADRYRPTVGRNKRWQVNLFDPDGSRTELMERKTVE